MRILITGGSGLLGSKIAATATIKGHEVYSGYKEHEAIHGTPIKLDICDKQSVIKAFDRIKPKMVVHAAALTNVDKCEEDHNIAWRVNVEGTRNILESSGFLNAFFIYVSTDYVFSGEEGMYKETDRPDPINNYGLTKLEAEKMVRDSHLEWCITRPSVIYGTTPASGKINFALWIINNLKQGKPIKIITDQWVSPTLNTNLAEMILEVLERRLIGLYHLAGATPINRYEYASLIAETFQYDKTLITPVKSGEMKWLAKRPRNTSLNVEKATETLRHKPLEIQQALNKLKKEIETNS
ncbi:MAG: dTDP-4-dehydrorhamnose reductase [Candidatus Hodarchaeota archaeon]